MRKTLFIPFITIMSCSTLSQAGEPSASSMIAGSSAIVSLGSSMLVSGIILSPVLLPISLVMMSVDKNKTEKTALLTAKDANQKDVKMKVPLKVVEEGHLKAGDNITLEKAPEGTGAYLKKDGKVLTHMVSQEDSGLSTSQSVPTK